MTLLPKRYPAARAHAFELSHETDRPTDLRRPLAVYRRVCIQARQEELFSCLPMRVPEEAVAGIVGRRRIDLTPEATQERLGDAYQSEADRAQGQTS